MKRIAIATICWFALSACKMCPQAGDGPIAEEMRAFAKRHDDPYIMKATARAIRAADEGNGQALYDLVTRRELIRSKEPQLLWKWIEMAAALGSASAMHEIALAYFNADLAQRYGVQVDKDKARSWCLRAMEAGNVHAARMFASQLAKNPEERLAAYRAGTQCTGHVPVMTGELDRFKIQLFEAAECAKKVAEITGEQEFAQLAAQLHEQGLEAKEMRREMMEAQWAQAEAARESNRQALRSITAQLASQGTIQNSLDRSLVNLGVAPGSASAPAVTLPPVLAVQSPEPTAPRSDSDPTDAPQDPKGKAGDGKQTKNGVIVERYDNGKIRSETSWKNGVRDGAYRSYWDNGKLNEDGWYTNGKKDRLWTEYSSFGEKMWERPYVNGALNGTRVQWFNDDDPRTPQRIAETIQFVNGKKQGELVGYWSDGVVSKRGHYDNDQQHGTWTTYDSKGKVLKSVQFDHGKQLGQ